MHYHKNQPSSLPDPTKVAIESIAANGDGYAKIDGKNWYIPYCQTGDIVLAKPYKQSQGHIHATIKEYIQKNPQTNEPICQHFTQCGGCKLQHLSKENYQNWKISQLHSMLNHYNINDYQLDDICFLAAQSRRRVTFRLNSDYHLSFNRHNSHQLIAIKNCPILETGINDTLGALQSWLLRYGSLLGRKSKIHITALNQIELTIISQKPIHPHLVKPLADLQKIKNIHRLCWQQDHSVDIIWQRESLVLNWNDIQIEVSPSPFLQASQQGEKFLQNKLLEYVGKSKIAVEFFCGMGTFSFPLLHHCKKIIAYDNAPLALHSARVALNKIPKYQGRLQFIERDLFRQPLLHNELNKADIVILDPPRAGAEEAIKQIGRSDIKRVVMVSCNPKTFMRDMNILSQSGFKLNRISMLDQFIYSPHIEIIGEILRVEQFQN